MNKHTQMEFVFRSLRERKVGPVWQKQFLALWPAYRRWFLRFGESERPTYFDSVKALRNYMPEFHSVYEDMVELAGGGDYAARFLAQYCPPPLFRGCSQAVFSDDGEPVLVRNYDYSPYVFDGLLMHSEFDQRSVIAMIDCMSGVLDGINDDGLAVSMTFGGREEFGVGFGITILLRYVLEYASNVQEACDLIKSIPVHGAYNITLLDRNADYATLEIAPDKSTRFTRAAVATNQQKGSSWPLYQNKVKTAQRFDYLSGLVATSVESVDNFPQHFLRPPLYNTQFARGFGTLYTAAYYPCRRECHLLWPEHSWKFGFDNFEEREYRINFVDQVGYPERSEAYGDVYTGAHVPVMQF